MALKLYDTLTREKRDFVPIDPANVRMYVCGPTVYDFAHIGNARPVIVFDVLSRLLRHLYGPEHVTYVRNITDVDDKINARAAERGIAIRQLTEETYANFKTDVAALGCLPPTVEPRATEHIDEMKVLIERLIANGCAYVAEDHVLFDVKTMPDYGRLSKRSLDEMVAGARVEVAPYKRDAMDFVLWKPSKPGEPAWPSPAGIATPGRPGWHIECSAMSWKHLGETFDIHGGGIDLVFPHHENEIAQSRCAFHTPVMANYWMHNGFLQVEGEKMSKSLGNFVTIRELLRTDKFGGRPWHGGVLRLAMLKTHYHQPIDFTIEQLQAARREMEIIHYAVARFGAIVRIGFEEKVGRSIPIDEGVLSALSDDLNTPLAISRVRALCSSASDEESTMRAAAAVSLLGLMTANNYEAYSGMGPVTDVSLGPRLAGFDTFDAIERLRVALANEVHSQRDHLISEFEARGAEVVIRPNDLGISLNDRNVEAKNAAQSKVQALLDARNAARKAKDFAESDRIRDELAAMGVVLKDTKDGTTWEIAR